MAGFVQSWGLQLVNHTGKPYDPMQLSNTDVIAFYFSAHWCPPCRQFTPLLKKFGETLRANGENSLRVIFISGDKTEHDMWKYICEAHGEDWLALAFSCQDVKARLERQYQVAGIPQLVVIDSVGRRAVKDAVGEVWASCGGPGSSSTQILTNYLRWKSTAQAGTPLASVETAAGHDELPHGTRVRVRGLTGAPEHNGMEGVVQSFDRSKRRYVVSFGEKSLSLGAARLLQIIPVRMRTADSSDGWMEHLISDVDEDTGELLLGAAVAGATCGGAQEPGSTDTTEATAASTKATESMRRGKLGENDGPYLQAGARVLVHSLQSEAARQWNERVGEVLDYDETSERYLVQVAPGSQLRTKPNNLRVFPLS